MLASRHAPSAKVVVVVLVRLSRPVNLNNRLNRTRSVSQRILGVAKVPKGRTYLVSRKVPLPQHNQISQALALVQTRHHRKDLARDSVHKLWGKAQEGPRDPNTRRVSPS